MSNPALFFRSLQDHLLAKLLSEPVLQYVSITQQRKQVLQDVAARTAPHLALRNGKTGSGILIGLPAADPTDDELGGLQAVARVPITILNKDDVALVISNGSRLTAEEIVYYTWQALHQFLNQQIGAGNWFVSGFDPIEDKKGAYGYLLELTVRTPGTEPAKCANVITTFAGGQATLTCATAGATIYYTTDGTFPGPYTLPEGQPANTSVQYNAPFVAATGTVILAAAYAANRYGSDVWAETAP